MVVPGAGGGDWWDQLNPFTYLGQAAGKVVADGWTAAMLGVWNAGLWLLKLVLSLEDALLTPDLSETGPAGKAYATTFWIAAALVLTLGMVQLGAATLRRDGAGLARAAVGAGQFAIAWAAWIGYGVSLTAACSGLTRALMEALLGVTSWAAWDPWGAFSTGDIVDGTVATVLGLLGLQVWLAGIGHLLVMLARAAALQVLAATTPISAAGLIGDVGRRWFWTSLRWFHAAAFTPPLMVLTLGIGVQTATGVTNGLTDSTQRALGTAVPAIMLILISSASPVALFKLLAFTDPGTASGAAMRAGLAAHGGLTGLLHGMSGAGRRSGTGTNAGSASGGWNAAAAGSGGGSVGSGAASSLDAHGRSDAEHAAAGATTTRMAAGGWGGLGGGLSSLASVAPQGRAATAAMAAVNGLGRAAGAAARVAHQAAVAAPGLTSDLTNQMGVGHQTYHPDAGGLTPGRGRGGPGGGPSALQVPDGPGRGGLPPAQPSTPPAGGSPRMAAGATSAPSGGVDGWPQPWPQPPQSTPASPSPTAEGQGTAAPGEAGAIPTAPAPTAQAPPVADSWAGDWVDPTGDPWAGH